MLKTGFRSLFALFFIAGGINHFVMTDLYLKAMPPYLPWHLALVYLSGIFEVVLGLALLVPRTRVIAGWGLIALLVAVFPANLQMYFDSPDASRIASLMRLPGQLLLILWAYYYTRERKVPSPNSDGT